MAIVISMETIWQPTTTTMIYWGLRHSTSTKEPMKPHFRETILPHTITSNLITPQLTERSPGTMMERSYVTELERATDPLTTANEIAIAPPADLEVP